MRVSEQLMKKYWLPVLIVVIAVGNPLSTASGQIVVPTTESFSDSTPAAGTALEWLNQAREAMSQKNAQLAEHYIQIADGLYQQRPADTKLDYTPEMARQELALLQASIQSDAQTPEASNNEVAPLNFPAPAMNVPDVSQVDTATSARNAMLRARQALAHGDVETATKMCNSAKQYQVDFSELGDSPRAIETMIFHQNNLAELGRLRDKSYNEQAAKFLLKQAKTLIEYQDFDSATMLLERAKEFPVEFTSETGTPDQLLTLIQSALQNTPKIDNKSEVLKLMSQAQLAMDQRNWVEAKSFIDQANKLEVPDSQFAAGEIRPWQMELKIQQALNMQSFESPEHGIIQTAFEHDEAPNVVHADYDPTTDKTHNAQVSGAAVSGAAVSGNEPSGAELTGTEPSGTELLGTVPATTQPDSEHQDRIARASDFNPIPSRGIQLYRSGLQALDNADRPRAREYFEMAWGYQDQLDSETRQTIQDHLSNLSPAANGAVTPASATSDPDPGNGNQIGDEIRESQQAMFRKLQGEVFKERAAAERLLESNPRQALEKMTMVRSRIAQAEIDPDSRRPLLTIIDRDISEMQRYIEKNLPEIINDETNAARMENVELARQRRVDVEHQIQKLVDDFNRLADEQRYAEAEMAARQAQELAPESEIVVALTEKSKRLIRYLQMKQLEADKERGTYNALRNSEDSSTPMDFDTPYLFDTERFEERSPMRLAREGLERYDTEFERRIWNLLKTQKVQGEYSGTLSSAVEQLSRQAGVNIIFDNMALAAEAVETDRSVNVPITQPISLESALNVILGSVGLVFVVEDEVIKVTSKNAQQRFVKPKTYYVGDLVMPITNFSSSMEMNFMQPSQGYNTNFNSNLLGGAPAPMQVAQQNQLPRNAVGIAQQQRAIAMAQQLPGGLPGGFALGNYGNGPAQTGTPTYNTVGPPRLGGVTEADFEPLIELIRSTVSPDSWDDTNGDGTLQAFVPNLSLIVSQTQEVQDQIQDLLKKLRELNDVQIVIEVRFITLQDSFFERIGVDFDFQINDNSNLTNPIPDEVSPSVVIGNTATGPTADLDVTFDQDSFASTIPQFGGFDVGSAANFGFAILSDIEVFFLIQASKGDQRSNITAAPTVTMFNGQSANVVDGAQRPFVTSVTPVVGDFAVAQQPIITILPEGTQLNVQAVVSPDRRYVRMTLVPFFSQVTDVETFTFDGRTSTRRSTGSVLDDLIDTVTDSEDDNEISEFETESEGVTIQLPILATTSVSTVVSVPDGGTVMMGGVKSMAEGRNERGVPFLSNIPYVNRLFKNVGIGRETSNRMMMVTPRIIIQEEEETLQVGNIGGN